MNILHPLLFSRTSTGAIQEWQMEQDGAKYRSVSGQQDGKLTESGWQYPEVKNSGKKNSTTPEQQCEKEIEAKYKKKRKEGYHDNVADIDKQTFFEPMLAKQFEDYQDKIEYPVAIEDKLNGICCLAEKGIALSRKHEQFFCVEHILSSLRPLFNQFPNLFLHGELFNPALKNRLNQISSLVSVCRKAKDVTEEDKKRACELVQFHVYDGYGFSVSLHGVEDEAKVHTKATELTAFIARKECLRELLRDLPFVVFHDYKLAHSLEEVKAELLLTRQAGSEGIMVKILSAPYEHKRSKNILKLKNFYDEEFEIVEILEGTGNWAGCAKTIKCKLKVATPDGRTTFDTNLRGTQQELGELLLKKAMHVGKLCTVEYQEKSEYGVPLIPYTQLPFRDYEG